MSSLASARVITCNNCYYEWIDAGAEDALHTMRMQTGNILNPTRDPRRFR